jgi:hypothetical protein
MQLHIFGTRTKSVQVKDGRRTLSLFLHPILQEVAGPVGDDLGGQVISGMSLMFIGCWGPCLSSLLYDSHAGVRSSQKMHDSAYILQKSLARTL